VSDPLPRLSGEGQRFELTAESLLRRRGAKWHRYDGDVLPAWIADMDFDVAEPVQRALRRLVDDRDYGYPLRAGGDRLEAAFADRMRARFGWEPDPSLVVPVADLVQAILAAIVALTEPGDGVVVQTPIYPPFLNAIASTGRRRVVDPLVDDGSRLAPDPDGLRRAADAGARLLLLCNPHNPSGRAFTRAELEEIGRTAVERDLVIVADEVHCDLVYPGARHVPVATLGDEVAARTVTLNSATKSFNIPGLRCAVMHLGSPDLLARFRRTIPDRLLGTVNVAGVDATVAAWRDGQPWLDAVMGLLAANRDGVAAWAAARAPGVRHHRPEATYLAWLDCSGLVPPGASAQRFFLEEARVALHDGADFGPGGEGCVRLNFATSPAILEELLDRMGSAIDRAAG
jgi:cystathionine beta-lyase